MDSVEVETMVLKMAVVKDLRRASVKAASMVELTV
jgi:hypothetical protein